MLILNDSRCNKGYAYDTIRKQCVPSGTPAAKYDGQGGWYIPEKTGGTTSSSTSSSTLATPSSAQLTAILNNTQLSAEEKQAITAVYNAVAAGDAQAAQQMVAKLELAGQFADPMLNRQIRLITAELNQTVQGMDQDLEYNEQKLNNEIADLREDVTFNRGQLSLQEQSELRKLERYFGEKLIETRDDMAARGMTSSRRRQRAEEILAEQRGDLVESTQREFAAKQWDLDESLQRGERETQLELERLQNLDSRDRSALALTAEEALGSSRVRRLDSLSGLPTLGGIEGNVDLDYRDTLANFAF